MKFEINVKKTNDNASKTTTANAKHHIPRLNITKLITSNDGNGSNSSSSSMGNVDNLKTSRSRSATKVAATLRSLSRSLSRSSSINRLNRDRIINKINLSPINSTIDKCQQNTNSNNTRLLSPNTTNKVKRNLFGHLNHDLLKKDLHDMWKDTIDRQNLKWNFDFESLCPLPGRYEWTVTRIDDTNIPDFYKKQHQQKQIRSRKFYINNSVMQSSASESSSADTSLVDERMQAPIFQMELRKKLNNVVSAGVSTSSKSINKNKQTKSSKQRTSNTTKRIDGVKRCNKRTTTTTTTTTLSIKQDSVVATNLIITYSNNRKDTLRSSTKATTTTTSSTNKNQDDYKQQSLLDMFKQRKRRNNEEQKHLNENKLNEHAHASISPTTTTTSNIEQTKIKKYFQLSIPITAQLK